MTAICSARSRTAPTASACRRSNRPRVAIEALNPDVKVITYQTRLDKENILDIFADYDIILDGTDNFSTRYLINDACVLLGKPNVHGSIFRFEGQSTVFDPPERPLLSLHLPRSAPARPRPELRRRRRAGRAAGIIGIIQATEVLKLALGIGTPLTGRLLMYDALEEEFRELNLDRDPNCPMCGEHGHTTLDDIEYTEVGCFVPALAGAAA